MDCVGVDLGGTAIKGGLLDGRGRILARRAVPTPRTADDILDAIAHVALDLRGRRPVRRLGVGAPAPVDADGTRLLQPPNIPTLDGVPMVPKLARRTGMRVVLHNDADCAGFGEFHRGAGRGARSMVLFTLGTGIGGAVVIDGRLRTPGELGHTPTAVGGRRCGCGVRGCLEAYASATAMQRAYGRRVGAKEIFDAARRGDRRAARVVERACLHLGAAVAGLMHTFEPELFVLAGGMAAAPGLRARVRRHAIERLYAYLVPRLRIVRAVLGNDAGWIGAAELARRHDGK
jgi:glucokinase